MQKLLITLVLLAFLPLGAQARQMPTLAETDMSKAVAGMVVQGDQIGDARSEAVQKPAPKCRKGLPGASCPPDAKAFLGCAATAQAPASSPRPVRQWECLPDGMADAPTVPPPRPA